MTRRLRVWEWSSAWNREGTFQMQICKVGTARNATRGRHMEMQHEETRVRCLRFTCWKYNAGEHHEKDWWHRPGCSNNA